MYEETIGVNTVVPPEGFTWLPELSPNASPTCAEGEGLDDGDCVGVADNDGVGVLDNDADSVGVVDTDGVGVLDNDAAIT